MAVQTRILVLALLGVLLSGLAITACGVNSDDPPPPPDYAKDLAGSPAPLASLHEQGNELLEGGQEALDKRLKELKGYPVVLNVWASWCGPCRNEFPYIQKAAAKMGKEVAFLGINKLDDLELATNFLSDYPVPFPSYIDPDEKISKSIGVQYLPTTAFYDAEGNQTMLHAGEFPDQESLDESIQKYAISGETD